jgi:integrase
MLASSPSGKAKIKPAMWFHVLRHNHGSTLAMRGVPIRDMAEQLGQTDTRMTEKHYAHLAPSHARVSRCFELRATPL